MPRDWQLHYRVKIGTEFDILISFINPFPKTGLRPHFLNNRPGLMTRITIPQALPEAHQCLSVDSI